MTEEKQLSAEGPWNNSASVWLCSGKIINFHDESLSDPADDDWVCRTLHRQSQHPNRVFIKYCVTTDVLDTDRTYKVLKKEALPQEDRNYDTQTLYQRYNAPPRLARLTTPRTYWMLHDLRDISTLALLDSIDCSPRPLIMKIPDTNKTVDQFRNTYLPFVYSPIRQQSNRTTNHVHTMSLKREMKLMNQKRQRKRPDQRTWNQLHGSVNAQSFPAIVASRNRHTVFPLCNKDFCSPRNVRFYLATMLSRLWLSSVNTVGQNVSFCWTPFKKKKKKTQRKINKQNWRFSWLQSFPWSTFT